MKYNTACRWAALFLFSIWYCSLTAQKSALAEGYCITAKGDSITGMLDMSYFNYAVFLFKANGSTDWATLKPADIQRAGSFNGVYILPNEIKFKNEVRQVLLLRLTDGYFDLYESKTAEQGYLYFVNSIDRPALLWINRLAAKTQLQAYFGECSKKLPSKLLYNSASLKNAVQKVNQCISPGTEIKVSKPSFHPELGIGANISAFRMHPKVGGSFAYHPIITGAGGITLGLKVQPAIRFDLGINYMQTPVVSDSLDGFYSRRDSTLLPDGSYERYLYRYYYRFVNKLDFKFLQIPVGVSVNLFSNKKNSVVFSGGATLFLPVYARFKETWGDPYAMRLNFQSAPVQEGYRIYIKDFKVDKQVFSGLYVGAGIVHKINARHEIVCSLQYFTNKISTTDVVVYPNTYYVEHQEFNLQRFQATLSYTFWMKRNK